TVRLRYGRDDGEAKTTSPAVAAGLPVPGHPAGTAHAIGQLSVPGLCAGAFGTSIEAVERTGRVIGGHAGPGVGDLEHDPAAHLRQAYRRRGGYRGVLADVAEQVREHLANAGLVDGRDQGFGRLRAHRPGRLDGTRVGGRVAHKDRQVGLGDVEGRGTV